MNSTPAQSSRARHGLGLDLAAIDELVGLLRESGIVDAQEHWAAGDTHLVSLGDLLDRGADSRRVMDLLMRLQAEASAKGGQVLFCTSRSTSIILHIEEDQ